MFVLTRTLIRTRQLYSHVTKRTFHDYHSFVKFNAKEDNFSRCSSRFKAQSLIPFVVEQTVYICTQNIKLVFVI